MQFYIESNAVEKDIVGIAVAGQREAKLEVCYYLKLQSEAKAKRIDAACCLLPISNIEKIYTQARRSEITSEESLIKNLRALNKQFNDENIVRDAKRSLFFSGLMIALRNTTGKTNLHL